MPSGAGRTFDELPGVVAALLSSERRAVMTTIQPDGSPHAVPVVFARVGAQIVSPIDHKPKAGTVMQRVRNLARDDRVTLLIDRWDEDWTQLVWLMVRGRAVVDDDPPVPSMQELNARYPQYEPDERHDALIRIRPERLTWWAWSEVT